MFGSKTPESKLYEAYERYRAKHGPRLPPYEDGVLPTRLFEDLIPNGVQKYTTTNEQKLARHVASNEQSGSNSQLSMSSTQLHDALKLYAYQEPGRLYKKYLEALAQSRGESLSPFDHSSLIWLALARYSFNHIWEP